MALDDALEALANVDERKSRVIEMRFFGGLSVEETAAALHVSPETVMRDWKMAKAWLLRELRAPARTPRLIPADWRRGPGSAGPLDRFNIE